MKKHFKEQLSANEGRIRLEINATNAKMDSTNAKMDATNAKLDATNAKLEATKAELDDLSLNFENMAQNEKRCADIDLYAEMRKSALNVVLDVSFGLGKEGASNFKKADELSATIAEYLERIVALANEIPPVWQIAPRLSFNYVRVTDVVLPNLRYAT